MVDWARLGDHSLSIDFARRVAMPPGALVLEVLCARSHPRPGPICWDAVFSSGPHAWGHRRLLLKFDPMQLIRSIVGSVSQPLRSMATDPVAGRSFGLAPAALTSVSVNRMLHGEMQ
jgi:hypothetical protein